MREGTFTDTTFWIIFAALVVLTLTTYFVAFVDLGHWNTPVALAIAAAKATLIILYFMHARYSAWLTWVVIAAGVFWLGILLVLTMNDYVTRVGITGF